MSHQPLHPLCYIRFSLGIQARDELLTDLEELVVKREEARRKRTEQQQQQHNASSLASEPEQASVLHKSVFEYALDDMRAMVGGSLQLQRDAALALCTHIVCHASPAGRTVLLLLLFGATSAGGVGVWVGGEEESEGL